MGWVMMSERELNRIEVLSQVLQGRMSAVTEADVLVLSYIMVQQQTNPPQVGPVGKQRDYYTPTGKRGRGRKSWLDKRAERRAAEAQAAQILQPPAQ